MEEKFIFIGLMEDCQNAINRLSNTLGFPQVEVIRENAAEGNGQIDDKIHDMFIKDHPLEYQVFNYVREIYYSSFGVKF